MPVSVKKKKRFDRPTSKRSVIIIILGHTSIIILSTDRCLNLKLLCKTQCKPLFVEVKVNEISIVDFLIILILAETGRIRTRNAIIDMDTDISYIIQNSKLIFQICLK